MARLRSFSSKFKANLVIELLSSGKSADVIAAENDIHPNMLRAWKREFLERAYVVFEYAVKHSDEERPKVTADYMVRIRELREELGLSQEQIGKMLGTSQTMYARYENGASKMPIKHLIILAQYYGVTSDYILGLSNEKWSPCSNDFYEMMKAMILSEDCPK